MSLACLIAFSGNDLQRHPGLSHRGLARVRLGRGQDGIRDLRESIRHQPDDIREYLSLVLALHAMGQRKAALDVVEMAGKLDPNNAELRALRQRIQSGR